MSDKTPETPETPKASKASKASKTPKNLSLYYIKELEELIELSEIHKDRISGWEYNFLYSISSRLEKYKENTFLSDKQLETIEYISKKIYATS